MNITKKGSRWHGKAEKKAKWAEEVRKGAIAFFVSSRIIEYRQGR